MPATFRNYSGEKLYTKEYLKVREFIYRINKVKLQSAGFPWGRWEWMIGHSCLDDRYLNRIGIWEDNGEIVAVATYESELGDGYFLVDERYAFLKAEMLDYARRNLNKDSKFRALIDNNDREFQRIARRMGFCPTQDGEQLAAIDLSGPLHYRLPEGFSIVSMADNWDWQQYNRCLWRGFNHPGEADTSDETIAVRKRMLSGPGVNPETVICVAAPNGSYVSHCGTWYLPGENSALVEPVATDPDYRKMGLGRAAVLEAVTRCGKLGATQALVGSSQQFYYSIGFDPIHIETWWEYKG
jgi:GNAT superfamily N-acetyltransferase